MKKLPVMNKAELEEKVKSGKYVIEFMAEWCPDCNFIKPYLPQIEADFPDYTFFQVDRDQNMALFQELNVLGTPSFIVYENGHEAGRLVNKKRKTKEEVENFIRTADSSNSN